MKNFARRSFLNFLPSAVAGIAVTPLLKCASSAMAAPELEPPDTAAPCWMDVCAPFVVQSTAAGIRSRVILTSDSFFGRNGHVDGRDSTEYEIYLYDAGGRPYGPNGLARHLIVPAMQTTVLDLSQLVPDNKDFWGGMRIRLRPRGRAALHASDLFSSAFVRWESNESFAHVHANPDPLQWQRADRFFYSMPFPSLTEYACVFSVFNPYAQRSAGALTLYDSLGAKIKEVPYDLKPHASALFDLGTAEYLSDIKTAFGFGEKAPPEKPVGPAANGGTIALTNQSGSVKSFGYLLIRQPERRLFSVEHPIHQAPYDPVSASLPFDQNGSFKARNILYTPLVFRSTKLGGLTLESRFHFSSGAPMEQFLWLKPFITDAGGAVPWQVKNDANLTATISPKQIERGVIKLGGKQSCIFDTSRIDLPKGFAGGLSLAVAPNTNHTLMKVEILAQEWRAAAFSHFRPGLQSARAYQKPAHREGLATDYIVSGASLRRSGSKILRDEIIGVINIDDRAVAGNPTLEIFSARGFLTRVNLGEVPAFACRHYLLSNVLSGKIDGDLSLRLIDEHATILMSAIHVDYVLRDIAIDHGSDRFSTFGEYTCDSSSIPRQ